MEKLSFGEFNEELQELDELEDHLRNYGFNLDNFAEWAELLTIDEIDEEMLDEKESQAAFITRMKRLGRGAARRAKMASFQKKKARKALKRKDAKQIQTTSTRQAQGDVVPKSIMKQKGAAGMIKRKMYKKMKKAMIDRKKIAKARTIKRGEASRVKAARASYFGKKK